MISERRAFPPGVLVRSTRFGLGKVELDKDETLIVRFDHGIEECLRTDLSLTHGPLDVVSSPAWHPPLSVITRSLAAAIQSVNDQWGVFSRSRIALLPHQLWVCHRVISNLPARWLVADDVGLGKTIEAGLILWPLLSKGVVSRLLVICPASLVEQWQYRLREMFDIRLAQYVSQADTNKTDFWTTHNQVVASLQTLRDDHRGRHTRLFDAPQWDLVIVDEAHHLNADEEAGPTLGYRLLQRLVDDKKVSSMVFFTGTPHRGKDFGFLSLMKLLRPDLFDPRKPMLPQMAFLKDAMIRNNKQNVTDLKGARLFKPPIVTPETYTYSPAEARFYEMLTDFISTGKAYASSLGASDARLVVLVLISMQKLASSSVAAIHRALSGRLQRLESQRKMLGQLKGLADRARGEILPAYADIESGGDLDALSQLEEQIATLETSVRLIEDEEPQLRQLIAAAEEVKEETKIGKIVALLETRFSDRQVLFFTEYKATQSLVMSALMRRFGDGCVSFINGDDRAEGVVGANQAPRTITEARDTAADRFNSGDVRFLVSTEAGGEGIDLQERCCSLVHVDLPWNPMRLHQRVGRLNRYGQTRQVEVITVRNPDTVESRIWDKLNGKIDRIMAALGHVMDEPEDLLQLVLGMTSPSVFRQLFSEASAMSDGSLSHWFDSRTASFGGQDVMKTVAEMVGHCDRFDFQKVSGQIPPLDLPDLRPFVETMLALNRRRVRSDEGGISFKTPEAWLTEPAVRTAYEGLHFNRGVKGRDAAQRILGVGHKIVDQAIRQALMDDSSLAGLSVAALPDPVIIARIVDRVTADASPTRAVVVGVVLSTDDQAPRKILRDWALIQLLNETLGRMGPQTQQTPRPEDGDLVTSSAEAAVSLLRSRMGELDLSFKLPSVELLAILWPIPTVAESNDQPK
jgi:superfamily II DNA or RNA helicase